MSLAATLSISRWSAPGSRLGFPVATSLVLVLACCRPAPAQERAYVVDSYSQLRTLDLDSGATEEVGLVLADGWFADLAFDRGNRLYGIAVPISIISILPDVKIYAVDAATGEASELLEWSTSEIPRGLAFDSRGRLWTTVADTLYSASRIADGFQPRATLSRSVTALAALGDQMYATTRDAGGVERLERLDLEALVLEPVSELALIDARVSDAAFDSRGTLRLLTFTRSPPSLVIFYRVSDLSTGSVVETWRISDPGDRLGNLSALAIPGPVEDIPTLDTLGLVVLAVAILLAYAFVSPTRRRRARDVSP